jgi:hypothetical protein
MPRFLSPACHKLAALCNSSASLAMFAAILRASSLPSNLGAAAYLKPYSRAIADMGI